jgi:putative ABC transport system permease protein
MIGIHELRLRWRALIHRRRLDRDLDDGLRFHFEMKASRHRESGMSPEDAVAAARRRFGSSTGWKETIREMWTLDLLESFMQDLKYAWRSLVKTPGFSVAALLVLTLGIGTTTAIFSVVNAVILRGLPYLDADRVVLLIGNVQRQKVEQRGNSYPDRIRPPTRISSCPSRTASAMSPLSFAARLMLRT